MMAGQVAPKVQTWSERQVFGFQEVLAEREGVTAKGADVGVQVERALRLYRNAEPQFAQGR